MRIWIFIIIALFFTACGSGSSTSVNNTPIETITPTIIVKEEVNKELELLRVACVGDSITKGYGLDNPKVQSYPSQLSVMFGDGWSVENYGLTNSTMLEKGDDPYSQSSVFIDSQIFEPEIVVIMLGTNDTKPFNWKYNDDFVADYTAFIKSYQTLNSNPRIWIAYPTPAFSDMAGISDEIIREEMIPLIDIVAKNTGVEVIDLYNIFSGRDDLFPDTIHPNTEGAKIIAETIYNSIY